MAKKFFFKTEGATVVSTNPPLLYDGADAVTPDGDVVQLSGDMSSFSDVVAHFPQVSQNSVEYVSLNSEKAGVGSTSSDPTDNNGQEEYCWIPTHNGTFSGAYGRCNTAPAAGQTFTLTVMKNGVATDIVVTFTDAGITANNTADSVSFVPGDRFAWKVETSATSGNFKGSCGLGYEVPGGEAATTVYGEEPTGAVDGVNDEFTFANSIATGTLRLFLSGQRQRNSAFSVAGAVVTFVTPPNAGMIVHGDYIVG